MGEAPSLASQIDAWRPAPLTRSDPLHPETADELAGILDDGPSPARHRPGDVLPVPWHWVFFLTRPTTAELGADGHPAQGAFLPPLRDRRRMFAGGRCRVERPLLLGRPATATSSLADQRVKTGRTGELLFVTVRTEFEQDGALCLVEEQDLVYRSGNAPAPDAPPEPRVPVDPPSGAVVFDPVTLFRYSAVSGNAHRIHYDLPYARDIEGHPGLLAQGPLLVLTLVERVRQHRGDPVAGVDYRLHRPVHTADPVVVAIADADTDADTDGTTHAELRGVPGDLRAAVDVHHRPRP
ncbi:HTD2 family dehydratase [Jatrophihabitans fulvus]